MEHSGTSCEGWPGHAMPQAKSRIHSKATSSERSEFILAMRFDGHVGRGVRDARQAETLVHLIVVEEGLIRLVDGTLEDLAGTAGARASATRVGELDLLFLGLVQDVHV